MRIFIADSSQLIRDRLVALLSIYQNLEIVGVAGDPEEAVRDIIKELPDVVIMDFQMPEQHGIEVIKRIKEKSQQLKFIIFTQYPYPQFRQQCLTAGADFFFDKATDFRTLIETITNYSDPFVRLKTGLDGNSKRNLIVNGGEGKR